MDLIATLKEKQLLVNQQKAILELVTRGSSSSTGTGSSSRPTRWRTISCASIRTGSAVHLRDDSGEYRHHEPDRERCHPERPGDPGPRQEQAHLPALLDGGHQERPRRRSAPDPRAGAEDDPQDGRQDRGIPRPSTPTRTFLGSLPRSSSASPFAKMANRKNANVLLLGDSGTGKSSLRRPSTTTAPGRTGPLSPSTAALFPGSSSRASCSAMPAARLPAPRRKAIPASSSWPTGNAVPRRDRRAAAGSAGEPAAHPPDR